MLLVNKFSQELAESPSNSTYQHINENYKIVAYAGTLFGDLPKGESQPVFLRFEVSNSVTWTWHHSNKKGIKSGQSPLAAIPLGLSEDSDVFYIAT